MLTYELKKSPGVPLYEALYRCVRADIRRSGTWRKAPLQAGAGCQSGGE